MMAFWLAAVLLVVVALLCVALPFFTRNQGDEHLDAKVNAARIDVFKQRLSELAKERDDALLTEEAYQQSVVEQKRRLLNELSPNSVAAQNAHRSAFLILSLGFVLVFTGLFYWQTGSFRQLNLWHDAMAKLPEYGQRAVMAEGDPLDVNERQAFALALRTKLANDGGDAVAWMLLGRVAMTLQDFEMAKQALEKALTLNPDNHSAQLSLAQVLLIEGQDTGLNRAAKLLAQVLRKTPNNPDAISLLAVIANERGDYREAKAAMEMLLLTMRDDDPRKVAISNNIKELDAKLALSGRSITVTVRLDDALVSALPAKATLFVFAKAANTEYDNAPAMPLAVVKQPLGALPLTLTLSEQNAMMANLTLANFDVYTISARISLDEDVAAAAGELVGQTSLNITEQQSVDVVINQQLKEMQ